MTKISPPPHLSGILFSLIISLTLILSSISISAERQQGRSTDISISIQETFIENNKHHPKLTVDQRTGLINKGYTLLTSILTDKVKTFPHKLEYLAHHSEFRDHWTIPFMPYGDKSAVKIVSDLVTSPLKYAADTFTSCLWSSSNSEEINPDSEGIETIPEYYHRAELESVISLIWALYDISYKTGNPFIRGSILLEDSGKKIHNYLEQYCCFSADVESPNQLMVPFNPQSSNLAYNRNYAGGSSHFVERAISLYGIDSRFRIRNFAIGVFPFKFTHLHTGRVRTHTGEELTFIKAEEEGLGDNRAIARHAINYGLAVPKTHMRREKDIPETIAIDFFSLLELLYNHDVFLNKFIELSFRDSPQNKRKFLLFLTMLSNKTLPPGYFKESQHIDISWIYNFLWDLKETPDLPLEIADHTNELLGVLAKLYSEKTLFMRTGNEILFSDEELHTFLKINSYGSPAESKLIE